MLNSGQSWWFFVLRDVEIWRMTLKINRTPLLYYVKLCASFQSHQWIETGVTLWKRSIWVKISEFFGRVTSKFDGWPKKNNRAPLLYHIKLCASFQSHQWIQTGVTVRKCSIQVKIGDFLSCVTMKFWWVTLKNNRAPLLSYFKLCTSFHSHLWFQTGVTVRKCPIWVKINDFFSCVTLKFDVWPWKTIGHLI